MKKILLTMMTLVLTIGAQAQNDSIGQCRVVVVYDFITNTTDKNGAAVTDSVQLAVMVASHVAKCMEYNRTMMEDMGEWKDKNYQYGEWNARKYNLPVLYVNHPEGAVSSFDKIVPNRYFYSEPLPDFQWKLTNDTLSICGYLCKKAVGKYAGRKWTAWYSEDVAAPFGPWKLCGLPGMILKACDADNIFSFDCVGLMQRSAPIRLADKNGYTEIDRGRFVSNRNKLLCNKQYVHNPRYYIPQGTFDHLDIIEMWPGGPEPPEEDKLTVVATDMIIPKKVNKYQPLELE